MEVLNRNRLSNNDGQKRNISALLGELHKEATLRKRNEQKARTVQALKQQHKRRKGSRKSLVQSKRKRVNGKTIKGPLKKKVKRDVDKAAKRIKKQHSKKKPKDDCGKKINGHDGDMKTVDKGKGGGKTAGKLNSEKKIVRKRRRQKIKLEETTKPTGELFPVLSEVETSKVIPVNRVLPDWLANPMLISSSLQKVRLTPVEGVADLCPSLVSRLRANNVQHFFPVQSVVVPWLLRRFSCRWIRQPDICVSVPTGSGKTLAFVLPIVQALSDRVVCKIRALVVLPVRDLAVQVYDVFKTYCEGSCLKVGLAAGFNNFATEQQCLVEQRKAGAHSLVDILVCTPGRLVDHIYQTSGFSLTHLRFLVMDEADRMMQSMKQNWLQVVERFFVSGGMELNANVLTVKTMPVMRTMPQKLLFSATLSQDPERLQEINLFQPKLFTSVPRKRRSRADADDGDVDTSEVVGQFVTPNELTETFVMCDVSTKPLILLHILHNLKYRRILCFTNSVRSSHRLYLLLLHYGDIAVEEVTASLSVVRRKDVITKFGEGAVDIVICSDTMARGIDILNVDYVISYDVPVYLKTYIHRVGRTARAGRPGTAISIVTKEESIAFQKMMLNKIKTKRVGVMHVKRKELMPLEERFVEALKKTQKACKLEKFSKPTAKKKSLANRHEA